MQPVVHVEEVRDAHKQAAVILAEAFSEARAACGRIEIEHAVIGRIFGVVVDRNGARVTGATAKVTETAPVA
jgi:hypothetical protein